MTSSPCRIEGTSSPSNAADVGAVRGPSRVPISGSPLGWRGRRRGRRKSERRGNRENPWFPAPAHRPFSKYGASQAKPIRERVTLHTVPLPLDLALKQWKTLTQSERDQVLTNMTERYGALFASEFLNYAKGVKKSNPGKAGALKGPEFTPKWLFDRWYRHAYGEIWVHPSGEYLMVLPPAAKEEGQKQPPEGSSTDKPDTPSQGAKEADAGTSTDQPQETYQHGGVTYDKKSGKIVSHDQSMDKRCVVDCLNNTKNEEDCSDCCVEKIPASDPDCLGLCISNCEDYYS
jgi:hypothetical protein